jgi:glutamate-ammonia-ligase adenylyltransferase
MNASLDPAGFVDCSRYAQEVLRRWRLEPDWLDGDAASGQASADPSDDPDLAVPSRLRRLRQLEGLRIQWQEYCGRHDIEQTGRALSALAERCLELALQEAERRVAERHGVLRDADGKVQRLAVLGLGKLGGDELNFNSDVDLVYCHAADGESDGARRLGPPEYFGRVLREFAALMEQVTAEGRVWVVDTRLRPFGQSGAMVWSIGAMEQYFINEGRAWERYAWLKARPVAGDRALGERLLERIGPFLFRRYLDYGLFDSLRSLHADIDRRSRRDDLSADIKRGPGGIRELEFLIQSLQLLRGGRDPALRRPGFLPALRAARRARLLDADEARQIDEAYRFLRTLENRLQLATGRQTHELPSDEATRRDLAALMRFPDWLALAAEIATRRQTVQQLFRLRFEAQPERASGEALWPPGEDLEARLTELGFAAPDRAAQGLQGLAARLGRRPLSAEGRRRLDRLMPELLDQVQGHTPPDLGLEELLALIETIARRSAYLALLHERPQTLDRCVRVFRRSARVAGWITASPQLLDDLLAPDAEPALPLPPEMQAEDVESSLNALARHRQAGFLRTAVAQLDGSIDRSGARALLTELAEQIIERMAVLFLQPSAGDATTAIIGYGNLGAAELHYSSDLDLVFLHDSGEAPLRPVQRMINAMQLPLAGGKLYEVDTRLRPNGNAGLLVSTLDSFADYQRRQAWTWEHQALIRARFVLGPDALRQRFDVLRAEVLARPRNPDEVRATLADMRRRQLEQRRESEPKRILGDIQFIAELGLLIESHRTPALLDARGTLAQLALLADCGWLDADSAEMLQETFAQAAELRDRRFLERDCDEAVPDAQRMRVEAVWRRVFAKDSG